MKSKTFTPANISICSIFAALFTVCSWISIPMGNTVLTLQTFAVFLALLTLGGKRTLLALAVWLLLGLAGAPVFSGFRGGIGMLAGPTGGFLWGFLVAATVFSLIRRPLIGAILACAALYLCGAAWFAWGYGGNAGFPAALAQCVLPFLLPDAAKLWLAFSLARRLRRFV